MVPSPSLRLRWQSRSSIVRSNSAANKSVCCVHVGGILSSREVYKQRLARVYLDAKKDFNWILI